MITASAIMTSSIQTAAKDTPILQAIEKMLEHSVSGLPVVDENLKVIGIITEKDVLSFYSNPKEAQKKTVGEVMTANVICINSDDPISEVCKCLIENDFRRVPVVSKGRLVGVISRPDVTRGILNRILRQSTGN
jgi:CBS domain-containing protein